MNQLSSVMTLLFPIPFSSNQHLNHSKYHFSEALPNYLGKTNDVSLALCLLQQVDKPPAEIKNELNRPQCAWEHLPYFHMAIGTPYPAVQGRRMMLSDQCLNCIWSFSSGQLAHMYSHSLVRKNGKRSSSVPEEWESNPRVLTSWDSYVRHTVAWAHLLGLWELISYTLH